MKIYYIRSYCYNTNILLIMRKEQKPLSGFFSAVNKEDSMPTRPREDKIKIANRFFLTTFKYSHHYYNAYNGIDIKDCRYIVAYLKLVTFPYICRIMSNFPFLAK